MFTKYRSFLTKDQQEESASFDELRGCQTQVEYPYCDKEIPSSGQYVTCLCMNQLKRVIYRLVCIDQVVLIGSVKVTKWLKTIQVGLASDKSFLQVPVYLVQF